jgi:uncharacterized protein
MKTENYFPTGIVTGAAFCNRQDERKCLQKRFEQNAHMVLMSPRRYGKSSLIAQFILDQSASFATIDLLPATSSHYVRNAIIDATCALLDSILPRTKKAQNKMLNYFITMNPVIETSVLGQRVKLTPFEKTPEETIMKLLLSLDKVASELKKKLIFVMDEFQQIAYLDSSSSLEASIRHAVERSRNVFYIFSGSNRTLLEAMFKDKHRPLYHLCDEMRIQKIEKTHYHPFLQKAAKAQWKKTMSEESIDTILRLTECHPYYVNRLCRVLWDEEIPPEKETIEKVWECYVENQRFDWVSDMISKLTVNQRAVLSLLAKEPESELKSKHFSMKADMPLSSIQSAVNTLLKQDLLFQETQTGLYCVLNPVIKAYLAKI